MAHSEFDEYLRSLNKGDKNSSSTPLEQAHREYLADKTQENSENNNWVSRALARGVDQTQALGFGAVGTLGSLAGSKGVRNWGYTNYLEQQDEASTYQGTEFNEISNPINAAQWGVEKLLENAPQLASGVLTGGLAAVTSTGTKMFGSKILGNAVQGIIKKNVAKGLERNLAKNYLRGAAMNEVQQAVISTAEKRAMQSLATKFGIVGTTAATESGGMWGEGMERGFDNPISAIALGTMAGFVEVLGGNIRIIDQIFGQKKAGIFSKLLGKAKKTGDPKDIKLLGRIWREAAEQAPGEFAQEALQESLALANIALNNPTFEAISKESLMRVLESGLAGAAVGGIMGGTTGAFSKSEQGQPDIETLTPGELARELFGVPENQGQQQQGTGTGTPEAETQEVIVNGKVVTVPKQEPEFAYPPGQEQNTSQDPWAQRTPEAVIEQIIQEMENPETGKVGPSRSSAKTEKEVQLPSGDIIPDQKEMESVFDAILEEDQFERRNAGASMYPADSDQGDTSVDDYITRINQAEADQFDLDNPDIAEEMGLHSDEKTGSAKKHTQTSLLNSMSEGAAIDQDEFTERKKEVKPDNWNEDEANTFISAEDEEAFAGASERKSKHKTKNIQKKYLEEQRKKAKDIDEKAKESKESEKEVSKAQDKPAVKDGRKMHGELFTKLKQPEQKEPYEPGSIFTKLNQPSLFKKLDQPKKAQSEKKPGSLFMKLPGADPSNLEKHEGSIFTKLPGAKAPKVSTKEEVKLQQTVKKLQKKKKNLTNKINLLRNASPKAKAPIEKKIKSIEQQIAEAEAIQNRGGARSFDPYQAKKEVIEKKISKLEQQMAEAEAMEAAQKEKEEKEAHLAQLAAETDKGSKKTPEQLPPKERKRKKSNPKFFNKKEDVVHEHPGFTTFILDFNNENYKYVSGKKIDLKIGGKDLDGITLFIVQDKETGTVTIFEEKTSTAIGQGKNSSEAVRSARQTITGMGGVEVFTKLLKSQAEAFGIPDAVMQTLEETDSDGLTETDRKNLDKLHKTLAARKKEFDEEDKAKEEKAKKEKDKDKPVEEKKEEEEEIPVVILPDSAWGTKGGKPAEEETAKEEEKEETKEEKKTKPKKKVKGEHYFNKPEDVEVKPGEKLYRVRDTIKRKKGIRYVSGKPTSVRDLGDLSFFIFRDNSDNTFNVIEEKSGVTIAQIKDDKKLSYADLENKVQRKIADDRLEMSNGNTYPYDNSVHSLSAERPLPKLETKKEEAAEENTPTPEVEEKEETLEEHQEKFRKRVREHNIAGIQKYGEKEWPIKQAIEQLETAIKEYKALAIEPTFEVQRKIDNLKSRIRYQKAKLKKIPMDERGRGKINKKLQALSDAPDDVKAAALLEIAKKDLKRSVAKLNKLKKTGNRNLITRQESIIETQKEWIELFEKVAEGKEEAETAPEEDATQPLENKDDSDYNKDKEPEVESTPDPETAPEEEKADYEFTNKLEDVKKIPRNKTYIIDVTGDDNNPRYKYVSGKPFALKGLESLPLFLHEGGEGGDSFLAVSDANSGGRIVLVKNQGNEKKRQQLKHLRDQLKSIIDFHGGVEQFVKRFNEFSEQKKLPKAVTDTLNPQKGAKDGQKTKEEIPEEKDSTTEETEPGDKASGTKQPGQGNSGSLEGQSSGSVSTPGGSGGTNTVLQPDGTDSTGSTGNDTESTGGSGQTQSGSSVSHSEGDSQGGHLPSDGITKNFDIVKADIDFEAKGEGKWTKCDHNISAIKIVIACTKENRKPTEAEARKLVMYSGWGQLKTIFDELKVSDNKQIERRKSEVKALLTDEEYAAARASTQNAYYTSPRIIAKAYKILDKLGFNGGKILEPSVGIGHFIGSLPEKLKRKTSFVGVDKDIMSIRVAELLYPESKFLREEFQKTNLPDGYFDVAIGNVPFGRININDRKFNKFKFLIHDYFFAKSLEKIRPGGLMIFITSTGTMDSSEASFTLRKQLYAKTKFIGAFRMPGETFERMAGTSVTTDMIIVQKLEVGQEANNPAFRNTMVTDYTGEKSGKKLKINEYFFNNPDLMLGDLAEDSLHGEGGKAALKSDGRNIEELIDGAIDKIVTEQSYSEATPDQNQEMIDYGSKPNSYHMNEAGVISQHKNGVLVPQKFKSEKVKKRMSGMIRIKDKLKKLLAAQNKQDASPLEVGLHRKQLNNIYDTFVKAHGALNHRVNKGLFKEDPESQRLLALERNYSPDVRKDKKLVEKEHADKADIFTKNTTVASKISEKVETAKDGLSLSLSTFREVRMTDITKRTGLSEAQVVRDLGDLIYYNPESNKWELAEEYLSGNVREKLERLQKQQDKKFDEKLERNIKALKKAKPTDLLPRDISPALGANWIPPEDIRSFIAELLNAQHPENMTVEFSKVADIWRVDEGEGSGIDHDLNLQFGTRRRSALKLISAALNMKRPLIRANGAKDMPATTLARAKQDALLHRFGTWLFSDDNRRERLVSQYNKDFRSEAKREYNGDHLVCPDMATEIDGKPFNLHSHQKDSIWRIIQAGNTLLAHVVGAGKTFTMVASAMEQKRLGLIKKPLFVVPNNISQKFPREFLELYPNANILAAGDTDMSADKRGAFMSKIATGDWDGVIIPMSSFTLLPISAETESRFLNEQLQEVRDALMAAEAAAREESEGRSSNTIVGKLETKLENLQAKLEALSNRERKDNVIDFEDLGIDMLYVDEAHNYKNLYFSSQVDRMPGIPTSESQRAQDLFWKIKWLEERTPGRSAIFATGTPVSNTLVELYNMQRFLQMGELKKHGVSGFDSWARMFVLPKTTVGLAPDGLTFRQNTGAHHFKNMPELQAMYRKVADIKLQKHLNLNLPELIGGKAQELAVPPNDRVKAHLQSISERMENMPADRREDNHLKAMGEAMKAALDLRLVFPGSPEEEWTKSRIVSEKAFDIWERTKDQKSTQAIFCDLSVPSKTKAILKRRYDRENAALEKEGMPPQYTEIDYEALVADFSVYDDIKDKLVKMGVPEEEIAFIQDHSKNEQKQKLFDRFNKGEVRILLGSTAMMGEGTNMQKKLKAVYHLDPPWKPAHLEQREGRIIRQGNENKQVEVFNINAIGSFDAYKWKQLKDKAGVVNQSQADNVPRIIEDVSETEVNYQQAMALATGDPRIMEYAQADADVQKYAMIKDALEFDKLIARTKLADARPKLQGHETSLAEYRKDIDALDPPTKEDLKLEVAGISYMTSEEGTKVLKAAIDKVITDNLERINNSAFGVDVVIEEGSPLYDSSFADFKIDSVTISATESVNSGELWQVAGLSLKKNHGFLVALNLVAPGNDFEHSTDNTSSVKGLIQRLRNRFNREAFEKAIRGHEYWAGREKEAVNKHLSLIKQEFEFEKELAEATEKKDELAIALGMQSEEEVADVVDAGKPGLGKGARIGGKDTGNITLLKTDTKKENKNLPKGKQTKETTDLSKQISRWLGQDIPESMFSETTTTAKNAKEAEKLAKLFNKKVVYVKNNNPDLFTFDGVTVPEIPDTIFVDASTGEPHTYIIGHELVHELRRDDESLYRQFAEAAVDNLKNFDQYKDKIDKLMSKEGKQLSSDKILEELLGDFVGDQMQNKDFWQGMLERMPNVMQDFIKFIKKFFQRILNKLHNIVPKSHVYFTDVQAVRQAAIDAFSEYAKQKHVNKRTSERKADSSQDPTFSWRDTSKDINDKNFSFSDSIKDNIVDIAKAIKMGSKGRAPHKPDTSFVDRLLSLPSHHFHKVPALKKLYEDGLSYADDKFNKQRDLMYTKEGESHVEVMDTFRKQRKDEYKTWSEYIVEKDRNRDGYSVTEEKGGTFTLKDQDNEDVTNNFETESDAWGAAINTEVKDYLQTPDASDQGGEALRRFRTIAHNTYDTLAAELKRIIALFEERGEEIPDLGVKYNDEKQITSIDLKEALAMMGDMRGYYMPRIRKPGNWKIYADKPNENPIMEFFETETFANKRVIELTKKGYMASKSKAKKMPDRIFQVADKIVSTEMLVNSALENMKGESQADKGVPLDQELMFAKTIVENIADIIKARGSRARMIKRSDAQGGDVVIGYEEDPIQAITKTAQQIAGGEAKKLMAGRMVQHMTGTDVSWQEFKQMQDDPENVDYKDYMKFVKKRRIDAEEQKNAYDEGMKYMQDMLRNDENIDRVIGTIKGFAVLKYLAGRISAPLINLTALVTSVPAVMNGIAGIPIAKSFKLLGNAGNDYRKFKFTGDTIDRWTRQALMDIEKKGWHSAQYNKEALSVLRSQVGRGWDFLIDKSMLMFSATEQLNRVATILAAYQGIRENNKGNWTNEDHIAALTKAKEVSDKSHGVYGKANLPHWARGANIGGQVARMFYVFKTFSHNYLLTMKQFGLKNKKASLYMALSPALVAGAGASILTPVIAAAAKGIGLGDDPEEEVYAWLGQNMGDYAESFGRNGVFGLANVNLKGSLKIGVTDLPTSIGDILGAPFSVMSDLYQGGENIVQGNIAKGAEKILPLALGAPIKAIRESTEGVTTRTNAPVFHGNEQLKASPLDAALRALSFNPARVSGIREKQWKERQVEAKYSEKRKHIYARFKKFYLSPVKDRDKSRYIDLIQEVQEYNERVIRKGLLGRATLISGKSIRNSMKRNFKPSKKERLRSAGAM